MHVTRAKLTLEGQVQHQRTAAAFDEFGVITCSQTMRNPRNHIPYASKG